MTTFDLSSKFNLELGDNVILRNVKKIGNSPAVMTIADVIPYNDYYKNTYGQSVGYCKVFYVDNSGQIMEQEINIEALTKV